MLVNVAAELGNVYLTTLILYVESGWNIDLVIAINQNLMTLWLFLITRNVKVNYELLVHSQADIWRQPNTNKLLT